VHTAEDECDEVDDGGGGVGRVGVGAGIWRGGIGSRLSSIGLGA
jgi:hypothetical protein